ncbi:MAG: PAS domain-containing protein, partial [Deltaproteobacteria bacterium]|nr:PAS domain-containing protein [Deltaproteobacteria bacterium]
DTQIVGRVWSYRDVTEPKRAEERLKNVNACLLDLGPDFEANIARLTGLCGEELGGTCALYNRLEGGMLCSRGQWHTPPDFESRDKPDGHICYDVIQHGGVDAMVVRNLPETAYATTDPNVNRYGLMTYAGHVVLCGGEPVGSLCVVFQEDVEPTDHDKSILGIIATSLGKEEERKRAEDAFKESESQYRLLVKQIPAVVFKGYQDWSVDFFDRKIESLTGYPKEEFDSRQLKWCDLILPEDLDMASGLFMQALKTDKSYVREYRIRKKDGEIAWVQARGQIFSDAAGQVEYASGVFFDITARKAAETVIHQERQRFFSLLDMLPALVCLVAPDFSVPFANRQFREVFGDPQGRTCHELSYGRQEPCDECYI